MDDINQVVQEKIDADADFQASIVDLSDDEKATAITTKKSEVLSSEFASLKEKADAAAKAEELANNYKIRAEKAEAEAKKGEKPVVPSNDFSMKDALAFQEAGVTSEDYDEVVRVAKILDKPIAEALKDTTLKTILETRKEERTTANATQTRGGARGTSKVSGEDLLSKAQRTGEVPETDEGMQAIFAAKMARRAK